MNILFFLTPKSEVAYIEDSFSLRQILEKMEIHRYSAIPILSNNGEYVGTITEGDILWYCKKNSMSALKTAETIFLSDIPKKFEYASVSINSNMEDLIARAMAQNFVPVVDDQNKFIGIVTRKDIIGYCYKKTENHAVRLIILITDLDTAHEIAVIQQQNRKPLHTRSSGFIIILSHIRSGFIIYLFYSLRLQVHVQRHR